MCKFANVILAESSCCKLKSLLNCWNNFASSVCGILQSLRKLFNFKSLLLMYNHTDLDARFKGNVEANGF